MKALDAAGTHYTKNGFPKNRVIEASDIPDDAPREKPGKPYAGEDNDEYRVVHIHKELAAKKYPDVKPGRYLVDDTGRLVYRTDMPIKRQAEKMDNDEPAPKPFTAPQPELFSSIIEGILSGTLEWGLVILGALIAVTVELAGVPALPFAVGMYLPFSSSTPIFVGGVLRLVADRWRGKPASEAEAETSPGVLLASGFIAGGTLCGLVIAFFSFSPETFKFLEVGSKLFGEDWAKGEALGAKILALIAFAVLAAILVWVGTRKSPVEVVGHSSLPPEQGGEEYPRTATGDERPRP
jgi:hypothetical protein